LAIIEASPQTLLVAKKKQLGVPPNMRVPSVFELWPKFIGALQMNLLQRPNKKTKHEIVGRERTLPLSLLEYALEKPQPKNEEESHIIRFQTLIVTFCKK
jgi:hypothetical protein